MEEILKNLSNRYSIIDLTLNNFTNSRYDDFSIDISIKSEEFGNKKIQFSPVMEVKIDQNAIKAGNTSPITITDISDRQWCEIHYKVCISNDLMSFYCKTIDME